MNLSILLLSCFCFINVKSNTSDDFLSVHDPSEECEEGWYPANHICEIGTLVWVIRPERQIERQYTFDYNTDFFDCINKCLSETDCVAISKDFADDRRCTRAKTGYFVRSKHPTWVTAEMICCELTKPKKLSPLPHHNLPIIFNLKTDCEPKSHKIPCCPNQMVWLVSEGYKAKENYKTIALTQRLDCMNQCIDDRNCHNVREHVGGTEECALDYKYSTYEEDNNYNDFSLECCNMKNESLWAKRPRDLPLFYEPAKFFSAIHPYQGQDCNIKFWQVFTSTRLDAFYHEILYTTEIQLARCLNYCIRDKRCYGVSIKAHYCRFHSAKGVQLNFGYRWYTAYKLNCGEL